jgi:glycosyltransferase involved in cell wall biosynthesis
MKIAILNHWDIGGGAARAAWRLFQGLKSERIDVKYCVRVKESTDRNVVELSTDSQHWDHIDGLVQSNYIDQNRTTLSNTYFSHTFNSIDFAATDEIASADIINLHWVEKMVSAEGLARLVDLGKPIVWTLHDQRPLTGGCHYTAGCDGFVENNCHQCRQLRHDLHNLPQKNLAAKQSILRNADVTIVSPSRWLADEARRSQLFQSVPIEVIPNSVETQIFRPISKSRAKEKLGLSPDALCIMFGAQNSAETRKGFNILQEALRLTLRNPAIRDRHQQNNLTILTVGEVSQSDWYVAVNRKDFGTINDDQKLAQIYAAADLFVLPSLEDNLPNTMLEAMACGTPVMGFNTGGIPDLVEPGTTGYLIDKKEAIPLSLSLSRAITRVHELEGMSLNCSNLVQREYHQEIQAKRYTELFRRVLSKTGDTERQKCSFDATAFDSVIGNALRLSQ